MSLQPFTRRTVLAGAIAAPVVCALPVSLAAAQSSLPAGYPTLPAVREFAATRASASIKPGTAIIVEARGDDVDRLATTATLLAEDLAATLDLPGAPHVRTSGRGTPHSIVLAIGDVPGTTSAEAYSISTANRQIRITGASVAGVIWGTQTLLQLLTSVATPGPRGQGVSLAVEVVDEPAHGERAVMIDCGRKYFSLDFMKHLVREMQYLKLNTLQLHMSEGVGFRIELHSHPQIVSDEYLTKAEVRELIAYARDRGVTINLDFDSPAHFNHILQFFPEHRLVLADGRVLTGELDISKAQARALVKEILSELMELFGSPVVHIGGDEYLPAPWQGTGNDVIQDRTAPQLVAWAREVTGNPRAGAHDAYVLYMNEIADHVRATGATARMWNDDVTPGVGIVEIDKRTQLDVWIRWNTRKPSALDFVRAGYQVMNSNGDYLYFILTGGGVGTGPYKNPKGIYERWHPRRFMGAAGSASDFDLSPEYPILGAHLSIWCDTPSALTQEQVAEKFQEWMQTFAQQLWGTPKPVPTLEEFRSQVIDVVGTAR